MRGPHDDVSDRTEPNGRRGVRFEREPELVARLPDHELWMAFFSRSEGNPLALRGELRGGDTG